MNVVHTSLTSQIAAQSAVAQHLATDLTAERVARRSGDQDAWTFRWVSCIGGDHRVLASSLGVELAFDVDLVINTVRAA